LRTAKGATYAKGSFAVQDIMSHGKVPGHGNTVCLCRGSFLCRALTALFAVQQIFVVRSEIPLLYVLLCRAFRGVFVVREYFVVLCCGLAQ
jgi:hypothetical protein